MLWDLPYMPDFDDLKSAWLLAQDTFVSFEELLKRHCMEEERKAEAKRQAELKKQKKLSDRADKWRSKYMRRNTYNITNIDHSQDKHGRLIKTVSEEEAMKLLATRKENKDVKPAIEYKRTLIASERVLRPEPPKTTEEVNARDNKPQTISKVFHNAGGKPT